MMQMVNKKLFSKLGKFWYKKYKNNSSVLTFTLLKRKFKKFIQTKRSFMYSFKHKKRVVKYHNTLNAFENTYKHFRYSINRRLV